MKIINISGEIGFDVEPKEIKSQLNDAKGKDIDIQISSPGGHAFKAFEIYNIISDYKKSYPKSKIMATIKGLAASAASYIASNPSIDKITAEENAVYMIHNAQGCACGDNRAMSEMSNLLDSMNNILAKSYAKKSGKKVKEIRSLMDSTTFYFGDEIKSSGFVDDMVKSPEKIDKVGALSDANIKMSMLFEKMATIKYDYDQVTALMEIEPENNITNPADTRENFTEVETMNFNELMAANPAANTEFVNKLDESKKAGYEAGKAETLGACSKAAVFAASKDYPEAIKAIAIDVMCGKKSMETLDAMVASADMFRELEASSKAKIETAAVAPTPGQPDLTKLDEVNAMIKNDRIALGLEVK